MFLIVFVTLVISIIGLFAQILSAQTAQLYRQQVAFMQTMTTWHGAAVNLARANLSLFSATPCRLTPGTVATGGPVACAQTVGASNLPPGYQTSPYTFYSIAYQSAAGGDYVITFVHDTDSNGGLKLPDSSSSNVVSYTISNLMQQLARAAPSNLSWGAVTASNSTSGTLTILTKSNGATAGSLTYTIPGSSVIPLNAVALLSTAQ